MDEVEGLGNPDSYFEWPELAGDGAGMVIGKLPNRYFIEAVGPTSVELLDVTAGPYRIRWWKDDTWHDAGEDFLDGGEAVFDLPEGATWLDLERRGR